MVYDWQYLRLLFSFDHLKIPFTLIQNLGLYLNGQFYYIVITLILVRPILLLYSILTHITEVMYLVCAGHCKPIWTLCTVSSIVIWSSGVSFPHKANLLDHTSGSSHFFICVSSSSSAAAGGERGRGSTGGRLVDPGRWIESKPALWMPCAVLHCCRGSYSQSHTYRHTHTHTHMHARHVHTHIIHNTHTHLCCSELLGDARLGPLWWLYYHHTDSHKSWRQSNSTVIGLLQAQMLLLVGY